MHHRWNQDYDQTRVDLPTQETHRLRGPPAPAIFLIATKAIAFLPLRNSTRLALIIGSMQLAAAITTLLASLFSQIGINFLYELVKLRIEQKVPEPGLSHLFHTSRWRARSPQGDKLTELHVIA